jgi:hypothetical protein
LERVGPYRVVRELGRGGIGRVFEAVDPAGTSVALKCLPSGTSSVTDERLIREAQVRIEHPNVVRTLGGGVGFDGRPYLVLELLRGQTLRQAFASGAAGDVVGWVKQAAHGVAAIHAQGLVHRDVKPENLFLCDDGMVKVLDLGIAAFHDEQARLTETGAVVGTPAYVAPEQLAGGPLDPRSDVWALGVVLFEGITGVSPFRRDTALATMFAVSSAPIPSLRPHAPSASQELQAIVARCLDRDPSGRFATASALANALEARSELPAAPLASGSPTPSHTRLASTGVHGVRGGTMGWGVLEIDERRVLVAVHGTAPPSDAEWQEWIEMLAHHGRAVDQELVLLSNLVVTEGGAPTTEQRARVNAMVTAGRSRPAVAVVTSNRMVRLMVRGFSIFNDRVRVFAPGEWRGAALHAGVPSDRFASLVSLVGRIEADVFGAGTLPTVAAFSADAAGAG